MNGSKFYRFSGFSREGSERGSEGGCGPMGGSGQTKFEHNDIFYD